MSATIIPFELQALRRALSVNPARPSSDQDASLFELVGTFIELTPAVDASLAAVYRSDADANRATMVRLGMDPGAPGAKGWADKDTEKDVFEKRMEVWRQVRGELGTDRINEESDELVQRHDAIFDHGASHSKSPGGGPGRPLQHPRRRDQPSLQRTERGYGLG
jgi:hypothetical protein